MEYGVTPFLFSAPRSRNRHVMASSFTTWNLRIQRRRIDNLGWISYQILLPNNVEPHEFIFSGSPASEFPWVWLQGDSNLTKAGLELSTESFTPPSQGASWFIYKYHELNSQVLSITTKNEEEKESRRPSSWVRYPLAASILFPIHKVTITILAS